MGENTRLQIAIDAANSFLNPVLDRDELRKEQGKSLLEILSRDLSSTSTSKDHESQIRLAVIEQALRCLRDIHEAYTSLVNPESVLPHDPEDAREDAKRRRILNALLDLISIEGVYPCLSTGVGIPLEKRVLTTLPPGVIAKQAPETAEHIPQNKVLLRQIISTLIDILLDKREGVQRAVQGRLLSDIISGTAELAFNPRVASNEEKLYFQDKFERIITQSPTSAILPTLSNFLRPEAALWFKEIISTYISQIPLREDGVMHTIWFLASQFAPGLGEAVSQQPSEGPPITVKAIMQISKLLSSVPQGMEAAAYFHNIAPKLLTLVDCEDPDLKRTAAYVVGSGILGKRIYGAPGTIGHSIFIEPLFKAITATVDNDARKWLRSFSPTAQDARDAESRNPPPGVLVEEPTLSLALERLCTITLQHPNPGLVKRLVQPILLPLWGIACYAHARDVTNLHDKAWALLQTYFSLSPGFGPFQKLVDNLLWDGGDNWTIHQHQNHGMSLITRVESDFNLVQLMDGLETRTQKLMKLLGSDPQSEDRTGDIFLHVSQKWLLEPSEQPLTLSLSGTSPHASNIVSKLVSAKIAERLLDEFKDTLSRNPLRVLELAQQLIQSELVSMDERERSRLRQQNGKASLESLANIAKSDSVKAESEDDQKNTTEVLSATFSLLSTILASPEFSMSTKILPTLENIKSQLDRLLPGLPASLHQGGHTVSMLLEIQIASPQEKPEVKPSTSSHITDFETHRLALQNISSSLPPVQAEGLSLLSKLISKSSPVLDIPSTLTLLLSLITEQGQGSSTNEDFIYLNAIKLVGTLAANHPRTVVKTLVERYADKNEERTLDQRLRVGEALLRTVQELGDALTGEIAQIIGDGMISVAGRRGHKPQTHKARKQQIEKERREKERKERENSIKLPPGWSVSSPALNKPEPEPETLLGDDDSDAETPEQAAQSANILAAWAAGSSSDLEPEDIRVRTSAISILATAIQTNLAGLGVSLASSAVDLALSTLTLEPTPEHAIIRRASAIILLDILRAIDSERESGSKRLGFGFSLTREAPDSTDASSHHQGSIGSIPKILESLSFVESRETDTIVRGHIRTLIESFEAWMEKSLLWGIKAQSAVGGSSSNEPRLELGDQIAGLYLNPLAGQNPQKRPRIEEIE